MKDLILESGELVVKNGDFVIDESDAQNCELLIRLSPGNIKQYPLLGYGEERLINGTLDGKARRDIQEALLSDNYKLKQFNQTEDNFSITVL